MKYAIYIALGTLIVCFYRYLIRWRRKSIDNNKRQLPVDTTPASDYPLDDFICIMLRDGTCRPGFISRKETDT